MNIRQRPKHAQARKHHLSLRLLMLLLGLAFLGFAFHEFQAFHSTAKSVDVSHEQSLPRRLKEKRPFSVLVMGTDVGALGRGTSYAGNTDTMELLTVNPQQQKVLMVAIPRDTLVKVHSKHGDKYVKINAAYAIGGPSMAKKQVSELLGVPVNYYALVNMGALKRVVNAVGGVDVDNPFAFTYEGHHFKKGRQHLNGNEALKYSRMRYDDPNNDYGRQKRGQQVINSVLLSLKKRSSITVANQVLAAAKDGVRTDMPISHPLPIYLKYRVAMNHVNRDHLQGKDALIQGVSFQIATPHEMNRVSREVRMALGLNPQHVSNNESRMYHQQTSWDGYRELNFQLPHQARYNVYQQE